MVTTQQLIDAIEQNNKSLQKDLLDELATCEDHNIDLLARINHQYQVLCIWFLEEAKEWSIEHHNFFKKIRNLCFLTNPVGNKILEKIADSDPGWFAAVNWNETPRQDPGAGVTAFWVLAGHVAGRAILTKLVDIHPEYFAAVNLNVAPQQGPYTGITAFYLLTSSDVGRAILTKLADIHPEYFAAVNWNATPQQGSSAGGTAFWTLAGHTAGRAILAKIADSHPEYFAAVNLNAAPQQGPHTGITAFYLLTSSDVGRAVLTKLADSHPEYFANVNFLKNLNNRLAKYIFSTDACEVFVVLLEKSLIAVTEILSVFENVNDLVEALLRTKGGQCLLDVLKEKDETIASNLYTNVYERIRTAAYNDNACLIRYLSSIITLHSVVISVSGPRSIENHPLINYLILYGKINSAKVYLTTQGISHLDFPFAIKNGCFSAAIFILEQAEEVAAGRSQIALPKLPWQYQAYGGKKVPDLLLKQLLIIPTDKLEQMAVILSKFKNFIKAPMTFNQAHPHDYEHDGECLYGFSIDCDAKSLDKRLTIFFEHYALPSTIRQELLRLAFISNFDKCSILIKHCINLSADEEERSGLISLLQLIEAPIKNKKEYSALSMATVLKSLWDKVKARISADSNPDAEDEDMITEEDLLFGLVTQLYNLTKTAYLPVIKACLSKLIDFLVTSLLLVEPQDDASSAYVKNKKILKALETYFGPDIFIILDANNAKVLNLHLSRRLFLMGYKMAPAHPSEPSDQLSNLARTRYMHINFLFTDHWHYALVMPEKFNELIKRDEYWIYTKSARKNKIKQHILCLPYRLLIREELQKILSANSVLIQVPQDIDKIICKSNLKDTNVNFLLTQLFIIIMNNPDDYKKLQNRVKNLFFAFLELFYTQECKTTYCLDMIEAIAIHQSNGKATMLARDDLNRLSSYYVKFYYQIHRATPSLQEMAVIKSLLFKQTLPENKVIGCHANLFRHLQHISFRAMEVTMAAASSAAESTNKRCLDEIDEPARKFLGT